jgi:NTP pyrophosphatase (non-canonical NTP hydrolase)
MDFSHYQRETIKTAIYPREHAVVYPALGLAGEAGEVAGKVKKALRDEDGTFSDDRKNAIRLELGDVLWYVAQVASDLGLELEDIAAANLLKLAGRQGRGALGGDGDYR